MFSQVHKTKRLTAGLAAAMALMLGAALPADAQISITPSALSYSQNFDGIDGTATTIPSNLPGWTLSPNPLKGIDCGNSSAGGIYAFGASGGTDYALGYQPAGSGGNDTFYARVSFINNTGSTIESVSISYNFERWRVGARTNGFMVTSDLGDVSALNQTGDPATGTNCNVQTTAKSVSLTGLSVPDGDTFYVTFSGNRGAGTGASQGVGIDDFMLTTTLAGAPALTFGAITGFGTLCTGDTSAAQSVSVTGSSLTGPVIITAPAGFLLSSSATGPYDSTLTLAPTAGNLSSTIYLLFAPESSMAYNDSLEVTGGGLSTMYVMVSGTGSQVVPEIVISLDHDLNICEGTTVTFSAVITNGGATPAIEWLVNGVPNGVTTGTFTTSTLDSGDVVSATVLSGETCAVDTAVTSNTITVSIYPIVTPSVVIASLPEMPVEAGTSVTFTTAATGVGLSPNFTWLVNGDSVATGAAYTSDSLMDGDVVTAILYTDAPCPTVDTAVSNAITVMISTGISSIKAGSLQVTPNPSKGAFQLKGQLAQAGTTAAISITNMIGQRVYQTSAPVMNGQINARISVASLPAGSYILRVASNGQQEHLRLEVR